MSILDISEPLLSLGLSGTVTETERAIVQDAMLSAEGAVKRFLHYDPARSERTEYYPRQDIAASIREGVWEASGDKAVLRRVAEAATNLLVLNHIPIRSITGLYIDYDGKAGSSSGAFAADTLKTEGSDYWANWDQVDADGSRLCRDGILNSIGLWPTTPGTIKVVYTAGYSAAELRGTASGVVNARPVFEALLEETCRRVRRTFALQKKTGAGWVAGGFTSERLGDYSYSIDGASAQQTLIGGDLSSSSKSILSDFVHWGWE